MMMLKDLQFVERVMVNFVGTKGYTVRVLLPLKKCKELNVSNNTVYLEIYDPVDNVIIIKLLGNIRFDEFRKYEEWINKINRKLLGLIDPLEIKFDDAFKLPEPLKRVQQAGMRYGQKSYAVYVKKEYAKAIGLIPESQTSYEPEEEEEEDEKSKKKKKDKEVEYYTDIFYSPSMNAFVIKKS